MKRLTLALVLLVFASGCNFDRWMCEFIPYHGTNPAVPPEGPCFPDEEE